MIELQNIFTEMLNHIDDHKEAYKKPRWTNEAIVKAWIKTKETDLKKIFINGVDNLVGLQPPHFKQKKMAEKAVKAKQLQSVGYSIREIMSIMNYKSPRSVQVLLKR